MSDSDKILSQQEVDAVMPCRDQQDGCPGWQLPAKLFQVVTEFFPLVPANGNHTFHRQWQSPGEETFIDATLDKKGNQWEQQQGHAGCFPCSPASRSPGPEIAPGQRATDHQAGNCQQQEARKCRNLEITNTLSCHYAISSFSPT